MPAGLSAAWIAWQQPKQLQYACHAANMAQQVPENGVFEAAECPFRSRQPLQGAWRSVAETSGHEEAKVEGGSLEQHPLSDLLLTPHMAATQTAAPQKVRKSAFQLLATLPQQAIPAGAGDPKAVRLHLLLRIQVSLPA
ncbi:MAG: hypothetical protein OXB95_01355, partial [Rhodobacteraceae bacterium]|nr:hypothetical protein [Paracoccaceae bacterium]